MLIDIQYQIRCLKDNYHNTRLFSMMGFKPTTRAYRPALSINIYVLNRGNWGNRIFPLKAKSSKINSA